MTRQILDQRMSHLQDEVLGLGTMVEQAAADSIQALCRRNASDAKRIEAGDRLINARRFAIEADCLALIAEQHPKTHDLRRLAAILEIITELERMGDYAKGIAHITLLIGPDPGPPKLQNHLEDMTAKANAMLRRALRTFVAGDELAARTIPPEDDEVDRLYNLVYQELADWINARPETIYQSTRFLWAAHNLERFADRVTNICERTIFTATGEMIEFSSSGGD